MLEHEGRYSARRGPYRIIYELDEAGHVVRVLAIGHRRDVHVAANATIDEQQTGRLSH